VVSISINGSTQVTRWDQHQLDLVNAVILGSNTRLIWSVGQQPAPSHRQQLAAPLNRLRSSQQCRLVRTAIKYCKGSHSVRPKKIYQALSDGATAPAATPMIHQRLGTGHMAIGACIG
jgi:hypothetical protein